MIALLSLRARCLGASALSVAGPRVRRLATLQASRLVVERTTAPKPLVPNKDLVFGRYFTDHMLLAEFDADGSASAGGEKGWSAPRICRYGPLSLDPSAVVFHYAVECFEGMKVYKDREGRVRLFRPDMNMARLKRSAARFALPDFDTKELLECIKQLVLLDKHWIPAERGYSLYLRPAIIASQESLGVGPSSQATLMVICSPVGPYYRTGFAAVSLLADPANIRAWPGGVGDCKVGGNYAPGILPQLLAAKQGFQQNLWLFPLQSRQGQDSLAGQHQITEVGTMNCFVYWRNEQGETELVTPALDGTILPGVTRDSILALTRGWGEFKVREGLVTMEQVARASKEGRLIEMFGAGTAAIVSPIKRIRFVTARDRASGEATSYTDVDVPLDPTDPKSQAGPLAKRLADTIMGIQYGEVKDHPWSVLL